VPEFCFFLLHHENIYNSPTNRNSPKGNLILGVCHSTPQKHVYPNNTNIPPMSSDFQAMSRPNHMMNIASISICTTKDCSMGLGTPSPIAKTMSITNRRVPTTRGIQRIAYPNHFLFLWHIVSIYYFRTIEIKRPVTRPPSRRSLRAVFPHRAPQYCSLRTKASIIPNSRLFGGSVS
jgi:hypothetical protein